MSDPGQGQFFLLETPAAVTFPLVKAHHEYHVLLRQDSADRVRHAGENHGLNLGEKPEKEAVVRGGIPGPGAGFARQGECSPR